MTDIPEGIRDLARAAFAGRPADREGQYRLDVNRNPWTALDDALAAVVPAIREQIATAILRDVCAPGEQCQDRFCEDCTRYDQARRDADTARGKQP